MIELATVCQDFARGCSIDPDVGLQARIERALGSAAMRAASSLIDPIGLTVERTPILHKYLSQRHLRLMFPVSGGTIHRGSVVSIVCLYDCTSEETLYAHPMHAGPNVNPLLKHPDGPMASLKAQPGRDGDRATARMIAHKEALWQRFLQDLDALGPAEASSRWRKGYYWALKRLYFCTRCTLCRWGTPFFDGPDPDAPPKTSTHPVSSARWALARFSPVENRCHNIDTIATVVSSDVWKIENAYAQRGGFAVSKCPRIVRDLGSGFIQLIFPTNAALVQGGTLVAVSVVHSTLRKETVLAHCLSGGPEPEIQFLLGNEAFGLPQPCDDATEARATYATWRLEAWSRFWLDELENGIAIASERWLRDFWLALEDLFGGNDLPMSLEALPVDRDISPDEASHNGAKVASVSHSKSGNGNAGTLSVINVQRSDPDPAIPFETLQNTGSACFAGHAARNAPPELRAIEISTLMVNLGRRCNQSCAHCHVDAGPHRTEEMSRETVDVVVDVLRRDNIDTLDITGGAPDMNPHFRYLASTASELCKRVVDRCNLTILFEPGHEDLAEFLAEHRIEITASLPSYLAETVDRQRGRGTFEKSIEALRMLNALGYGEAGTRRVLNLVYNPVGTDLAEPQSELEGRFKHELGDQFGVVFNRLFAMNNMPVNRFRDQLVRDGCLESYMDRLVGAFNPTTVDGFMCRHSLSVAWDGRLYDCDFNQAAALPLRGGLPTHIRDFDASALRLRAINTGAHCFGCAAGNGSSCRGGLASAARLGNSRRNGRTQEVIMANTPDPRTTI